MEQMIVRDLDAAELARLRERARLRDLPLGALVRAAINGTADLSRAEKVALAMKLQQSSRAAMVAGKPQTPAEQLVRADRAR